MGLLLRGVDKEDLHRGMVLAAQVQLLLTKFKASVYVSKKGKKEGILHFLMVIVRNFIFVQQM